MASTALVTFVFDCPAAVRTVELLGSWDNFSKSYQLKRDRRRGPSIWWGCYTFQDIICDGDLDDLGSKRNGALKMGGTYWYYYKVDGDDEHHNPTEPSTTVCPLLPGQRLNVLDVPIEESTQTTPYSSDVFTRNPEDKYLTPVPPAPPVPPKPYPSPGLGSMFKEPSSVSTHHLRTPRSATYPSTEKLLSPGPQRHVRSASTTPSLSSTPLFADFKSLKEKLAAKRSAASTKELQIGAPTLVSHTNEDLDLVPLGSFQFPSRSSPMPSPRPSPRGVPQTSPSPQLPNFSRLLGRFSPLGSHPVDSKDTSISPSISPTNTYEIKEQYIKRPRSHIPSTIVMSEFKLGPVRARANSADTRRTRHYLFSNEPWLSSPIQEVKYELDDESLPEVVEAPEPPAPVLKRPSISLVSPIERPTSSYGGDRNSELRTSPLDKELPALPRYLVPAPLFACSSAEPSPTMLEEPLTESPAELEAEEPEAFNNPIRSPVRSHFSVWSTGSFSSPTSPASDDDEVHSPTFSSLTSTCSDVETPQRLSTHFTQEEGHSFDETKISINVEEHNDASNPRDTLPPQLEQLHLSGFGPNLFNLDIQLNDSGPRRHATCFGLDFKGYSLPEDETTSKTTITESFLQPDEPAVAVNRRSSVSHFSKLMNEFGYLGESVV